MKIQINIEQSSRNGLSYLPALFAIPWSALVLNTEEKCFYLNIDKEQLENAPGFDKDHWPNMADHEWGRTVYDYYGVDPYWD